MFIGDHTGTAKKKKWEKSKHFIEVIIDDEHYMVEIIKPKKEKKK